VIIRRRNYQDTLRDAAATVGEISDRLAALSDTMADMRTLIAAHQDDYMPIMRAQKNAIAYRRVVLEFEHAKILMRVLTEDLVDAQAILQSGLPSDAFDIVE
jgi:hypothetical protein